MNIFAERPKELRIENGLSLQALAEETKIGHLVFADGKTIKSMSKVLNL